MSSGAGPRHVCACHRCACSRRAPRLCAVGPAAVCCGRSVADTGGGRAGHCALVWQLRSAEPAACPLRVVSVETLLRCRVGVSGPRDSSGACRRRLCRGAGRGPWGGEAVGRAAEDAAGVIGQALACMTRRSRTGHPHAHAGHRRCASRTRSVTHSF